MDPLEPDEEPEVEDPSEVIPKEPPEDISEEPEIIPVLFESVPVVMDPTEEPEVKDPPELIPEDPPDVVPVML